MKSLIFFISLMVATVTSAQDIGQRWSIVGGRTVGSGAKAIVGDVGWPGLGVSGLFGVASGVDVGIRASFVYGIEGQLNSVRPGVKGQALLKVRLYDGERVSFSLTFEPGAFIHAVPMLPALYGIALPIGFKLGIASSSAVHLGFSLDVPVWFQLGPTSAVTIPILAGLGTEYFVTSELLAFTRIRMGPSIQPGLQAQFALDAQLGLAYRF